jgi:D-arabinose 1-dehydrogenase-like Zn-dependent alcohol dehydrogenase
LRLGAGDSAAGAGQVRIRVHACGICFSDHYVKDRFWPGLTFPRTSEHEVAGTIDEVGAGVTTWKKGQRVGVGWHGGQDGTCISCRRGDFGNCVAGKSLRSLMKVVMRSIVAPVEAVASMPESLDPVEAAPSLYAGSPRLMHCGTAALCREIWWQCRASSGWALRSSICQQVWLSCCGHQSRKREWAGLT